MVEDDEALPAERHEAVFGRQASNPHKDGKRRAERLRVQSGEQAEQERKLHSEKDKKAHTRDRRGRLVDIATLPRCPPGVGRRDNLRGRPARRAEARRACRGRSPSSHSGAGQEEY